MWSYPNLIPLDEHTVRDVATRVARFRFDRVYGGWWGRVIVDDGAEAVRRSADRYIARLKGERPATPCRWQQPDSMRSRPAMTQPTTRRLGRP